MCTKKQSRITFTVEMIKIKKFTIQDVFEEQTLKIFFINIYIFFVLLHYKT